jgi:hypothetical protein
LPNNSRSSPARCRRVSNHSSKSIRSRRLRQAGTSGGP